MRRDSFDRATEDLAEDMVEELPDSSAELAQQLPENIEELSENVPEELVSDVSENIDGSMTLSELLAVTPLERYLERSE